ncbi:MAG: ATP-binding protein [Nitrosomonas sp.]
MINYISHFKKNESAHPNCTESSFVGRLFNNQYTDQHWRLLYYFNIYRLIIGCVLIVISWKFDQTNFGSYRYILFIYTAAGYTLFSFLCIVLTQLRFSKPDRQLTFQLLGDILFYSTMLYASGGLQSGLGVLILISLAIAGLIDQGRMALFFASIATISLLFQETYASFTNDSHSAQYSQAGLLSMAYFVVAWLAQQLTKNSLRSEKLANERGIDLANMSQVNQLIIQELPEGVLVIDEKGNIRQYNALAQSMLNINSPNSASVTKLTHLPIELVALLTDWQKKDVAEHTETIRIPCSDTLVYVRWIPIISEARNGAVIFLEDMGRMEARLQQLKLAALGRLTSNIAHEIRNPLSAINHAAELILETNNATNTDNRLMHIICENSRRLNKIVQDALQITQKQTTSPGKINLAEFIEIFLEQFCLGEKIHRNIFTLSGTGQCKISFDYDHLNQILWNLCSNAFRHSTQQPNSVQIKFSRDIQRNNIILDIIDNGLGLDKQKSKQIFEPFYTTAPKGTGLGLFIARELCEANQAFIEFVENPAGAHFRVRCKEIQ